jgi:UPF0271 protein
MSTDKAAARSITLNADMGESFGIHSFGNDSALLPLVESINVACGMHSGDPGTMHTIVEEAAEAGVLIGAHPGLPDLVGFGRRAMDLTAAEVRDLVRYQVGALSAFLGASGVALNHIKPHGALYAMLARSDELMGGLCEVALQYGVPVYGLAGTCHESAAVIRGVPFVAELYVDLDYRADGTVVVNRAGHQLDLERAASRTRQVVEQGTITAVTGEEIQVRPDTICIHSDLPNSVDLATTVRRALREQP